MVKSEDTLQIIRKETNKIFESSVVFLVACGSLGRGDVKKGWSDIDLFLVLNKLDIKILKKVKKLEKVLDTKLKTETDIAVVSKREFFETPYNQLPDKFKNYIFFINQEKIIIGSKSNFRKMSIKEYLDSLQPFILDYHRRLRRLIIDNIDKSDNQKRLLLKIIKFLFLLLRKISADINFQPNTYYEAIVHARKRKIPLNYARLIRLMNIRNDVMINKMSKKEILNDINNSYQAVIQLTDYYINSKQ